jgi:hypothetical protein
LHLIGSKPKCERTTRRKAHETKSKALEMSKYKKRTSTF